jgi:ribosomal protein S14
MKKGDKTMSRFKTIDQLLAAVQRNELTVDEAAEIALNENMHYAVLYYDAPKGQFETYVQILRKFKTLEAEQQQPKSSSHSSKPEASDEFSTQLWEPCERCGAEPCYATRIGHLCRKCYKPA